LNDIGHQSFFFKEEDLGAAYASVTSLKSKGDVDVAALRLADWQGALT
jgi:hypothetical protein